MKSSIEDRAATMLLPIEARIAAMLAIPPPTGRVQYLGLCNCDWVTQCCVRKKEPPDRCTFGLNSSSKQCHLPVHFECQLPWERYADLTHEKKCTSRVCREHHPKYQHWRELHRKPVAVHEKEERAKDALNSFVWAREGEHKGAKYHQCQVLDRIAENGQVWVKWTSTGNVMCIPTSNIEEPTQGQDQKHSVVSNIEKNPKKQRKEIATGDALPPVLLLTDTPPTPPYSRKTQSSGDKGDDGQSGIPGLKPVVSRKLKMTTAVQASTTNATTNKKRTVPAKKPNATTNTNVAEETIMSEFLEGTADNDFSQSREIGPPVNGATVEVTAETIEVTVDDANAEVNRKLRTIEALDLMEPVMEETLTKRVLNWITTMMQ
jgi:hypothetical protein